MKKQIKKIIRQIQKIKIVNTAQLYDAIIKYFLKNYAGIKKI